MVAWLGLAVFGSSACKVTMTLSWEVGLGSKHVTIIGIDLIFDFVDDQIYLIHLQVDVVSKLTC